jgi:hypothetical protein
LNEKGSAGMKLLKKFIFLEDSMVEAAFKRLVLTS